MTVVWLTLALIVLGLIVGFAAGFIWKDNRPIGVKGDYIAAVVTAVAVGLLDYYVIPAMGFSDTMRWLGVSTEPWLSALLVLWLIRYVKK